MAVNPGDARVRVAVLVSGRGSNLGALMAAAAAPDYPARIALVLSNRGDAAALDRARDAGIRAVVVDSRPYGPDRAAFEAGVEAVLHEHRIGLVALAGFMRVLSQPFVRAWCGRMLNIHPSLLPAFPGLHTHARALAAGVRVHGCTVHFVSPGVDEGPVIAQAAVPVLAGDDDAALAARVLEQEHRLYPACLAWVARGEAVLEGNRVRLAPHLASPDIAPPGGTARAGALANPHPEPLPAS